MPSMGFEQTIPAFERANKYYALNRTATVIGSLVSVIILKKGKKGKVVPVIN
jgi:hypothetical protein